MKKNHLAIVIGLLLVIAIGILAYQFVFRDSPNIRLPVAEGCLLHLEPCASEFPGGGCVRERRRSFARFVAQFHP